MGCIAVHCPNYYLVYIDHICQYCDNNTYLRKTDTLLRYVFDLTMYLCIAISANNDNLTQFKRVFPRVDNK